MCYVCGEKWPAPMLAVKRSVGVAPEVNLSEHTSHTPLPSSNKVTVKPRGDVTRTGPKQGYQWPQKGHVSTPATTQPGSWLYSTPPLLRLAPNPTSPPPLPSLPLDPTPPLPSPSLTPTPSIPPLTSLVPDPTPHLLTYVRLAHTSSARPRRRVGSHPPHLYSTLPSPAWYPSHPAWHPSLPA